MDVQKILGELYSERVRIEYGALALEVLEEGQGKCRGRPPKWLVEARRRLSDGPEDR